MKTVYNTPTLVEIAYSCAALCEASIDPSNVSVESPFDNNVEYDW